MQARVSPLSVSMGTALLAMSAPRRVLGALAVGAALWLCVWWAL
jgi:hypothetical protein